MNKARYVPDLQRLMSECESNYARLLKLFPDMDTVDSRSYGISAPHGVDGRIHIEVVERFKYTLTLCVTQELGARWLGVPKLVLRFYQDARMAEVVEQEVMCQLKGAYSYPNQSMYHSDEKLQLNLFLGEWLRHCLAYGRSLDVVRLAKI